MVDSPHTPDTQTPEQRAQAIARTKRDSEIEVYIENKDKNPAAVANLHVKPEEVEEYKRRKAQEAAANAPVLETGTIEKKLAEVKAKIESGKPLTAEDHKFFEQLAGSLKAPEKTAEDRRTEAEIKQNVTEWNGKIDKFYADLRAGKVDFLNFEWLRGHSAVVAADPKAEAKDKSEEQSEEQSGKKGLNLDWKKILGGGIGAVLMYFVGSMFGAGPFGMIASVLLAIGGFVMGSKFADSHFNGPKSGGSASVTGGRSITRTGPGVMQELVGPGLGNERIDPERPMTEQEFAQILQAAHNYMPYPDEEPRKHHKGGFLGLGKHHREPDRYEYRDHGDGYVPSAPARRDYYSQNTMSSTVAGTGYYRDQFSR